MADTSTSISASTKEAFASFYLQRATQEFAEDLDKARTADDFKPDSVPFLVHALQQGTALYSDADKLRVMNPPVIAAAVAAEAEAGEDGRRAASESDSESQDEERTAKKEQKRKRKRKSEGRS